MEHTKASGCNRNLYTYHALPSFVPGSFLCHLRPSPIWRPFKCPGQLPKKLSVEANTFIFLHCAQTCRRWTKKTLEDQCCAKGSVPTKQQLKYPGILLVHIHWNGEFWGQGHGLLWLQSSQHEAPGQSVMIHAKKVLAIWTSDMWNINLNKNKGIFKYI